MADEMKVIITLIKTVPDRDTGRAIYDLVKARMADNPDVQVNGHVSNHFDFNLDP